MDKSHIVIVDIRVICCTLKEFPKRALDLKSKSLVETDGVRIVAFDNQLNLLYLDAVMSGHETNCKLKLFYFLAAKCAKVSTGKFTKYFREFT